MNCTICGAETRVLHKQPETAKRRRECVRCKHRFNTFERTEEEVAWTDAAMEAARELSEKLLDVKKAA